MKYDESYYERGVQLGISGYSNYRWLPDLTLPMCRSLASHIGLKQGMRVLDYGCAKGFMVRALRELGYDAEGVDLSEYAISNADDSVKSYVRLIDGSLGEYDWIVSKDVLEHVPYLSLRDVLQSFHAAARRAFIIVPLAENGRYVVPEYEQDVTHIIREDAAWWVDAVHAAGYTHVCSTLRVPGIKDNWSHYERGNLFLTASYE